MLVKYREELTRPVQEAMDFMRRIEAQLNVISNGRVNVFSTGTIAVSLPIYHVKIHYNFSIPLQKFKD